MQTYAAKSCGRQCGSVGLGVGLLALQTPRFTKKPGNSIFYNLSARALLLCAFSPSIYVSPQHTAEDATDKVDDKKVGGGGRGVRSGAEGGSENEDGSAGGVGGRGRQGAVSEDKGGKKRVKMTKQVRLFSFFLGRNHLCEEGWCFPKFEGFVCGGLRDDKGDSCF